eukprot:COSAG01_NODE_1185_length_11350_cov_57.861781_6_plen_138_part_00
MYICTAVQWYCTYVLYSTVVFELYHTCMSLPAQQSKQQQWLRQVAPCDSPPCCRMGRLTDDGHATASSGLPDDGHATASSGLPDDGHATASSGLPDDGHATASKVRVCFLDSYLLDTVPLVVSLETLKSRISVPLKN